jgi:hypothetical protein
VVYQDGFVANMLIRENTECTPEDLRILGRQLGRPPFARARILARCAKGRPALIGLGLVNAWDGKSGFFPTAFWLTCPHLRRQIGCLEDAHWIAALQARLAKRPGWQQRMQRAHARQYAWAVRNLAGAEQSKLSDRGIGGMADWRQVKCLHLHFAHSQLDRGNIIGRAVSRLLKGHAPRGSCQEC